MKKGRIPPPKEETCIIDNLLSEVRNGFQLRKADRNKQDSKVATKNAHRKSMTKTQLQKSRSVAAFLVAGRSQSVPNGDITEPNVDNPEPNGDNREPYGDKTGAVTELNGGDKTEPNVDKTEHNGDKTRLNAAKLELNGDNTGVNGDNAGGLNTGENILFNGDSIHSEGDNTVSNDRISTNGDSTEPNESKTNGAMDFEGHGVSNGDIKSALNNIFAGRSNKKVSMKDDNKQSTIDATNQNGHANGALSGHNSHDLQINNDSTDCSSAPPPPPPPPPPPIHSNGQV